MQTKLSHILRVNISKRKSCFNGKSSAYYFHVKMKVLADFQICISVPLIQTSSKTLLLWIWIKSKGHTTNSEKHWFFRKTRHFWKIFGCVMYINIIMNIISCLISYNLIIPCSSAAIPKMPIPHPHSVKTLFYLMSVKSSVNDYK